MSLLRKDTEEGQELTFSKRQACEYARQRRSTKARSSSSHPKKRRIHWEATAAPSATFSSGSSPARAPRSYDLTHPYTKQSRKSVLRSATSSTLKQTRVLARESAAPTRTRQSSISKPRSMCRCQRETYTRRRRLCRM